MSASAGDMPVVECGVFRYCSKNVVTLSLMDPWVIFASPYLTDCTALSASPFVAGW